MVMLLCLCRRRGMRAAMRLFHIASPLLWFLVVVVRAPQFYCPQHCGAALRQWRKQGLEDHTDVPSFSLSHVWIRSSPSATLVTEKASQRPLRLGSLCVRGGKAEEGCGRIPSAGQSAPVEAWKPPGVWPGPFRFDVLAGAAHCYGWVKDREIWVFSRWLWEKTSILLYWDFRKCFWHWLGFVY